MKMFEICPNDTFNDNICPYHTNTDSELILVFDLETCFPALEESKIKKRRFALNVIYKAPQKVKLK